MLLREDLGEVERVALGELRQHDVLLLLRRVRARIDGREAREDEPRAGGLELVALARRDRDAHRIVDGRRHLTRGEALPDELVELPLILGEEALELVRRVVDGSRTDGLMRVLRLLAARVDVRLCRHVVRAERLLEVGLRLRLRELGDARRVGAHVGDEARRAAFAELDALVELLREHHCLARGKAELARGILLQRARREGRGRTPLALALLHRGHGEELRAEILGERLRRLLVVQDEVLAALLMDGELLAVHERELRLEERGFLMAQFAADRPVFLGLERLDLLFPVAD